MSTSSNRIPITSTRTDGAMGTASSATRRGLLLAGGGAAAAVVVAGGWWLRSRTTAGNPSAPFAPAAPIQTDPFAGVAAKSAVNAADTGGQSGTTAAGPAAPDFTAAMVAGGKFTLSAQRGKPVLLLFTAGWCTSCIPEVQKLAKLQAQEASNGLIIAALDVDPTEKPADFLRLKKMAGGADHVWAMDTDQQATKAYGVRATDTKVLVDRMGRIAWQAVGATPMETLEQQVYKALTAR